MNPRTAMTSLILASAMLAGTYSARKDRAHPERPTTTREKQAKNKYRRRKGKR